MTLIFVFNPLLLFLVLMFYEYLDRNVILGYLVFVIKKMLGMQVLFFKKNSTTKVGTGLCQVQPMPGHVRVLAISLLELGTKKFWT